LEDDESDDGLDELSLDFELDDVDEDELDDVDEDELDDIDDDELDDVDESDDALELDMLPLPALR